MRLFIRVLVLGMLLLTPSCTCTDLQKQKSEDCWKSFVEVATSPQCLNECIAQNWVACATGCGMGLLSKTIPECWEALETAFTTPTAVMTPAYMLPARAPVPQSLVCKPTAPASCHGAQEAIRAAFEARAK